MLDGIAFVAIVTAAVTSTFVDFLSRFQSEQVETDASSEK